MEELTQKDILNENIDVENTIKREAMEELKINNPRRNYLVPLLQMDSKGIETEIMEKHELVDINGNKK